MANLKTLFLTKFVNKYIGSKEIKEAIYPDLKQLREDVDALNLIAQLYESRVSVTAAQFSASNVTPIQLVAAPTDGTAIEAVTTSIRIINSSGIVGSTTLQIGPAGLNTQLQTGNVNWATATSGWAPIADTSFTGSAPDRIVPNTALVARLGSDLTNELATGSYELYVLYRYITPLT